MWKVIFVVVSIVDKDTSIIGLYGMPGVGKTTFLKRIHNEFGKREHDFNLVLWVVVSRDCDINRIMNDIRIRIGIDDYTWRGISSQDQRAAKIYQVLKQKKFVMMIDDVWDKLELVSVGVPNPKETNNKSKVLFTTRYEDVCAKMQAEKKFKVECLNEKESFELFCKKVGDETLKSHTQIPKIAWLMNKECAGLPLAIATVGSAMAGVKNNKSWMQAKDDLRRSAWITLELQEKVFEIIKFSYDRLHDDTHKKCFLYCALYPEDYEIRVDDLILRWIGEGFLVEDKIRKSLYDMYGQGESIIEKLKLSSLLESVEVDDVENWVDKVKMHDVIRDMALWIARDKDQNKDKVLVEGEALTLAKLDFERLNLVEKISIINSTNLEWKVGACPNLITLCNWSGVADYSNLKFMERLKVLDLSYIHTTLLLTELGMLFNLEYLNISHATLENRLPVELKSLKNLRVFLMEHVDLRKSDIIPLEVIESLEKLQVFKFSQRTFHVFYKEVKELLDKLESLPKLEEVDVQVNTITAFYKLLESNKLLNCLRNFVLEYIKDTIEMSSLLASFSRMKHLEFVDFYGLGNIIEGGLSITTNTFHLHKLRCLKIHSCDSLTHLTWLKYAPFLEVLEVYNCDLIEEVVREFKDKDEEVDEFDSDVLSNLRFLTLCGLPALKSIHRRALDFSSLKMIKIHYCPNLRKLPLNSNSAAKDSLVKIKVESTLWNDLEWDDPKTSTTFQHLADLYSY